MESRHGLPLKKRPRDLFFVFAFSFFAFSSFCSDALHGLDLVDADSFWGRANLWYGEIADDQFFLQDNEFARLNTAISGLIYGPFYLVLVFSFVRGANWVRTPALIYVGAMLHGYLEFMWWEYAIGPPPGNPAVFWAFNAPYFFVPLLLGVRMWKPTPFGQLESGMPRAQTDVAPAVG